jgi:hypothetical protein
MPGVIPPPTHMSSWRGTGLSIGTIFRLHVIIVGPIDISHSQLFYRSIVQKSLLSYNTDLLHREGYGRIFQNLLRDGGEGRQSIR